ncbi:MULTISPECIES: metallophosphoesterase [unclassified Moraxella]|uniref:metallophosphoesterase n=1 Tax=unclassified Moraxella TaxID=2685852 RepID=UPI003AF864EB
MIYDVIGDIHGQADKLIGLLTQLGYVDNGKFFAPPPNHQAVFIGDLIDRGRQELKTLEIVFAMLDNGSALAVMGNHEYNALAFATSDKRNSSEYLRSHNKPSNVTQHQAFLDEVGFDSELHHFWLKRFFELPLWLELDNVCFVHACWDGEAMAVLQPLLTADNRLTDEALQLTSYQGTTEFEALERVLKGVETRLPDGHFYLDKEGTKRKKVRVQWWLPELKQPNARLPIHHVARAGQSDLLHIPVETLADEIDFRLTTDKFVFVGHYWLTGVPQPLSEQVVCVDYSAVKGGYLTAYQFDTDNPSLSADNFVQYIY